MSTKMKSRGNGTVKIGSRGGIGKRDKEIKIKPISFSELLACKVADGSKTVTRRLVGSMVIDRSDDVKIEFIDGKFQWSCWTGERFIAGNGITCPYHVGQLLYVREPWQAYERCDHLKPSELADDDEIVYLTDSGKKEFGGRYRQARFMPKRFARTFLRVTAIRCERLQEITEEDAIAEGIDFGESCILMKEENAVLRRFRDYIKSGCTFGSPIDSFASLWDSINHKKDQPKFKDNPWVWVIKFEKVDMPNPWRTQP